MRTSKIAALVAILAGAAWITSGVLSWDEEGLTDLSTQLWWGGLGAFSLASALTGYSAVTKSPIWLKAIVFLGAAALGGSVVASLDTDLANAPLIIAAGGGVLLLLGLIGLVVSRGGPGDAAGTPPRGGRRAAR